MPESLPGLSGRPINAGAVAATSQPAGEGAAQVPALLPRARRPPAWDGPVAGDGTAEAHALDRLVHASLGQWTGGISPASVFSAYSDWATHLLAAPGKQQELVAKAWRKWLRLASFAVRAGYPGAGAAIEPLEQDARFRSPQWQQWPFNLVYQTFLFHQQWWHNASSGVRGVTRHHDQVVTFLTRQWIDVFSPSNLVATNPEVLQATVREGGMNLWRGMTYWWQDALRLAGVEAPADAPRFVPGLDVAVTPGRVVLRNELIELIQYEPATPRSHAVPLLIVPSWIMKYYILDLSPENSLVRYLVEHGYTVFIVSWRNPGPADRAIGMEDYLKKGVIAATEAVRRIVPGVPINAVGYCLGGTLLSMAASLLAREGDTRLNSLTLLAAETDFSEPGELGLFIDESQLAYLEDIMWEQGYLDGRQMTGAFTMLNSRDLIWSRIVREYLMGERRAQTDLAAWNADATRMPYRQHREYLERLYLNNALAEGSYLVDGRPIALSDIHVPMFVVGTQRDTVSPWRSVYKIHLFTGGEITFCLTSGGHNVGVVNPPVEGPGRSFQVATRPPGGRYLDPETWQASAPVHAGSWWPRWEQWLGERSGVQVAAPAPGNEAAGLPPMDAAPGRYVLMP